MTVLLDLAIKGSPIAILIEKVEVVECFQDLNELDDVGRVNLGEHLNLIESAFF